MTLQVEQHNGELQPSQPDLAPPLAAEDFFRLDKRARKEKPEATSSIARLRERISQKIGYWKEKGVARQISDQLKKYGQMAEVRDRIAQVDGPKLWDDSDVNMVLHELNRLVFTQDAPLTGNSNFVVRSASEIMSSPKVQEAVDRFLEEKVMDTTLMAAEVQKLDTHIIDQHVAREMVNIYKLTLRNIEARANKVRRKNGMNNIQLVKLFESLG